MKQLTNQELFELRRAGKVIGDVAKIAKPKKVESEQVKLMRQILSALNKIADKDTAPPAPIVTVEPPTVEVNTTPAKRWRFDIDRTDGKTTIYAERLE